MIKNIFLKNFEKKRKAISPLIATILLVVVAVAIIGIVVSWGKGFTTSSLDQTTNVYKQADETIMLSFQSLDNGVLIFKNISTFDKDLEITGYKIFSENNHPLLNKMNTLQTPVTIKRNLSQKISIPVPVERKFNMELYTSDGYYIPLKNISTGKTPSLFSQTFGGLSGDFLEKPNSLLQTSDGGYLVLGGTYSFGAGNSDIYLLKTDVSGNLDWNKTFGGSSSDSSTQVIETSDAYYIFGEGGGYLYDAEYDWSNFYIIKTDFSGNSLKEKIIGGKGVDNLYSVAPSSEGGFLLGGLTFSFGGLVEDGCDAQILILKIDSQLNYNISNLIESLFMEECEI